MDQDFFNSATIRKDIVDLACSTPGSGVWHWDLLTGKLTWSSHVYAIFQVTNFDHTLESFQKLIHPDDLERGIAEITQAIAFRIPFRTSFRAILHTGEVRYLGNIGKARYNRNGHAVSVIGTIYDITSADPWRNAKIPDDGNPKPPQLPAQRVASSVDLIRKLRDDLRAYQENKTGLGRRQAESRILELLLTRANPDAKMARKLAFKLIRRFGSMANILSAPKSILTSFNEIEDSHLDLFEVARAATEIILEPSGEPVAFDSTSSMVNYLRAAQAYLPIEQLRVIYLDRSRHIILNEVAQSGTVNHTPVYVREILKRALEVSASSIMLVHNHPSGNPEPSYEDIQLTEAIARTAAGLGIAIDDHIILGRHGHFSMKSMELF